MSFGKKLCISWWQLMQQKNLHTKKFNLQWIYSESSKKDWKWFAKCFATDNLSNGLSVRFTNSRIMIGEMKCGKLNGWGIREVVANTLSLTVGLFENGVFTSGTTVWESSAKHVGELREGKRNGHGLYYYVGGDIYSGYWKNSKREGRGVYTWKNGRKYEGEYIQDSRNGLGTMFFPDGFHFETTWEKGKPLEKEVSVHPLVKERIAQGACTSDTKDCYYPQYFHTCTACQRTYCYSCKDTCHNTLGTQDHISHEEWLCEDDCYCKGRDDCEAKKEDQEPPTKRQKTN